MILIFFLVLLPKRLNVQIHFLSVIKSCIIYIAFTYFLEYHFNLLIHGSLLTQWEAMKGGCCWMAQSWSWAKNWNLHVFRIRTLLLWSTFWPQIANSIHWNLMNKCFVNSAVRCWKKLRKNFNSITIIFLLFHQAFKIILFYFSYMKFIVLVF